VIGLDRGERTAGRIDGDEREARGRRDAFGDRGRLVEHDGAVDAEVVQPVERGTDVGAARKRDEGDGEVSSDGGGCHGFEHPRVADRRQGGDDHADRAGAPGAQSPGGAVGPVTEVGHGGLDTDPRLGVDPRAGVDDPRDGLPRDARGRGHVGHRDASLHGILPCPGRRLANACSTPETRVMLTIT